MPLDVRHFGSYEILAPLGAGGMGEVYKARDIRLDRTVALKILPSDFSQDKERIRRFNTEAKAAAALSHPNVAQIYEIGESEEIRFIAMEYIEGRTLDQLIDGAPLESNQIVQIAMQITDALQEAHRKGVTHRDIKPSNIMLTAAGVVKVLDFGLAKVIKDLRSDPGTEISTITRTRPGILFGTIQYLSPEQALGLEADSRSDLFSMGIVLYEMSTGQLPFHGRTAGETLDQIIHAQPKLPSELNRDMPADLEKLILRCLEKKPERRYQSTADISKDLINIKTTSSRIPLFLRQLTYRFPAFVFPLLLVLLLASAALYYGIANGRKIDSLAILPFLNQSKDSNVEYVSDGITESLISNLSQVPKLRVMSRDSAFSFKGRKITAQKAGSDLKVAAVLSGKILQRGDKLTVQAELIKTVDGSRLWSDQYEGRPIDAASIQEQITNEISKKLKLQKQRSMKPRTANNEAFQLWLKGHYFLNKGGDFRAREEGIRKALEYFNQAIKKDQAYASAYSGVADCLFLLTFEGMIPSTEGIAKAKAAAIKALELDPTLPEVHVTMGTIRQATWEFTEEAKEYRKAIELNPTYADAHHWYGEHLGMTGRINEAVIELRRAQELDPFSIHINNQLAFYLFATRHYDEALEICKRIASAAPDAYSIIAAIYAQKGMYKQAIEALQKRIPKVHPESAEALGRIFATSGYEAAMKDHFQRILAYYQKASKLPDNVGFEFYDIFANCYGNLKNIDQSIYWLEQGYREHSPTLPALLTGFRLDPDLRAVRSDPRFAKLLQRVGLPVRSDLVEFQH